ncbi:hypothetical protein SDRG_14956 [Saprolegnia diclina VS20]|uniref:CS domain-containing protein n=1 Tax=Saprolegnia diclina (strain VS20) TaxID=1156394 RepID=T0Q1I4_SAPDV|nr:hypothetical protein SDRG_14956 [Saprolegnia diclina VS20]EQC27240.1 hypothetical protein SDRG_14956 [Saprolegnia diclina VS20]|eukprot:XP_008619339.1 hypothetical protein SDRG_14956 [Saprolegnia diclina VS20]
MTRKVSTRATSLLDAAADAFDSNGRHDVPDDATILSRAVDPKLRIGWTQTRSELYVYIPVRPRIVQKGVNILATEAADKSHWLTIIVDTIPRAHVRLAHRVLSRSLDWEIGPQKEASPFYAPAIAIDPAFPQEVVVTLVKEAAKHWSTLYYPPQ